MTREEAEEILARGKEEYACPDCGAEMCCFSMEFSWFCFGCASEQDTPVGAPDAGAWWRAYEFINPNWRAEWEEQRKRDFERLSSSDSWLK